jgi:hypothetical protein
LHHRKPKARTCVVPAAWKSPALCRPLLTLIRAATLPYSPAREMKSSMKTPLSRQIHGTADRGFAGLIGIKR